MNENLLHFIWKFRLFDQQELKTTNGERLKLLQQGIHNKDAGADFQNARIRIEDTLWAGNVEIHIKSDDWLRHKHQHDSAYDNTILHVVYEVVPTKQNGLKAIPTLELKERINPGLLQRYALLSQNQSWVPCEGFIQEADKFTSRQLIERLAVERLENKVSQINLLLEESENDWEQVMYQMLARYFGAAINKEPFQLLAKSLPIRIWAKHQHDSLQTEALVFGQAGLLDEEFDDDYPQRLKKEYRYLKKLYALTPLPKHIWKFLRLRPSNFPTLRLAQFAALMQSEVKFFSRLLEAETPRSIEKLFDVQANEYWKDHYLFDKEAKKPKSNPGKGMKSILLINAVAPVLFAYGKYRDDEDYCDRALQLLQLCEAEQNAIIKRWGTLNMKAANAFETQALLQLKNEYCDKFRCLECSIGHNLLS